LSSAFALETKVAGLDDAFSEIFELKAIPVKGQSLQQKREEKE